jgi:hypothetical protein
VPIKPTRTIEPKPARRAVAARPAKGTRGAFALLGLRDALKALSAGDFSVRLGRGASDIEREVAIAFGSLAERLDLASAEVIRVSTSMARDGETRERAALQGAAGTWRELIDNVNQLADDLGAQVRAITDVSTAVTHGDLSPSIRVEARSEVLTPRGNLDQMIGKLRETMARNQEQDWLKTNLARFSGMMQGQKNIEAVSRLLMSELTPLVSAHHGAFFVRSGDGGAGEMKLVAGYAFEERKNVSSRFKLGEGLVGQCALEKKAILLTNVPGDYVRISSEELQQTNEELEERSSCCSCRTPRSSARTARSSRRAWRSRTRPAARAVVQVQVRVPGQHVPRAAHAAQQPAHPGPAPRRQPEGNLDAKQVEFASTIHSAGSDLLSLINDILDLSKIESGTMASTSTSSARGALHEYVERTFRRWRRQAPRVHGQLAPGLPPSLYTDPRRLQQVLKNLLANAFKFTERGGVTLEVASRHGGLVPDHPTLGGAERSSPSP